MAMDNTLLAASFSLMAARREDLGKPSLKKNFEVVAGYHAGDKKFAAYAALLHNGSS